MNSDQIDAMRYLFEHGYHVRYGSRAGCKSILKEKLRCRALAKRNNLNPKRDITELCTVTIQML
jgi:hypothetical protein